MSKQAKAGDYITKEEATILLSDQLKIVIENVKSIMKKRNMSQQYLADTIDVERSRVTYLLNRKDARPTFLTIVKISKALETSISELSK